jgi:hypothetical protein
MTEKVVIITEINASSQITRAGFWGKGIKVYYLSDKEDDGQSTAQTSAVPFLKENVALFKRTLRAHFKYMTKIHVQTLALISWFTSITSSKLHIWLTGLLLGGQREKGEDCPV